LMTIRSCICVFDLHQESDLGWS